MKKTLIEDNWWLLKFFAAKSPAYVSLFAFPLILFWAIIAINSKLSFEMRIISFASGLILWSFLEYFIHRFLFHAKVKNEILRRFQESFHMYHHRVPKDQRVFTSGLTPALFWSTSMFIGLVAITNSIEITSHVILAATCYYYFYEWVHHLVHVKKYKSGIFHFLQDLHMDHHRRGTGNYGQTTHLWDVIFGTYTPSSEWKREQNKDLFVIKFQK